MPKIIRFLFLYDDEATTDEYTLILAEVKAYFRNLNEIYYVAHKINDQS